MLLIMIRITKLSVIVTDWCADFEKSPPVGGPPGPGQAPGPGPAGPAPGPAPAPAPGPGPSAGPDDGNRDLASDTANNVRSNFPETWIWTEAVAGCVIPIWAAVIKLFELIYLICVSLLLCHMDNLLWLHFFHAFRSLIKPMSSKPLAMYARIKRPAKTRKNKHLSIVDLSSVVKYNFNNSTGYT